MAYIYKNPKLISSPKGKVEVIEVLYDGADDPAYSLALIKWEGQTKLGIRWNIAEAEWDDAKQQNGQAECIGNPQSRGHSTWFVLPDDSTFYENIKVAIEKLKDISKY